MNAEHDPCSRMFIGPAPFSEPETEAVAQYLANHNDSIKAYLAYHSFSQLWMMPYSYSKEQNPHNLEQLVSTIIIILFLVKDLTVVGGYKKNHPKKKFKILNVTILL